jgi:hypothetical protein
MAWEFLMNNVNYLGQTHQHVVQSAFSLASSLPSSTSAHFLVGHLDMMNWEKWGNE